MGNIVLLDELTINKIAAGEVIERPASVIKEMAENSIDAGATQITVEIRRGGITYIRITDNGSGIPADDVVIAFEKHATSKIRCGDDLDDITTLGFRGEALSSISAVSKLEVTTKLKEESHGVKVAIHGGALIENTTCGCPEGTTFVVKDLFFNTPARYKFLKKDATEASHIIDLIERMALAHPEISFKLINNSTEVLRTRGDGILKNVIYSIYGKDIAEGVKAIDFKDKGIEISGFAGNMASAVSSRGRQSIFVNGRYIRSKVINSAIDEAYGTLMMRGKYPFIVLNIKISTQYVDVNVHPNKMEVRFSDDGAVYRWVYDAIGSTLFSKSQYNDNVQYSSPFNVKTKSEVKEDKATYTADLQELQTGGRFSCPDSDSDSHSLRNEQTERECHIQIQPVTQEIKAAQEVQHVQQQQDIQQTEKKQTEEPSPCPVPQPVFTESIYVGQAFNTYIILQYNDEIIFLDQHAAHERILYEEIKEQYKNTELSVQPLLTPIVIEPTSSEYLIYKDNKDYFKNLGFEIEEFGDGSIILREIPVFIDISAAKQVVLDIIRDIMDNNISIGGSRADISDDVLKTMACKAAVKANNKLSEREVRALLESMSSLKNPFSCPHGRPLVFKMTNDELKKKFKRIL